VLRTQLQCRERDLSSLRVTVQEKEAQVQVPRVLYLDSSFIGVQNWVLILAITFHEKVCYSLVKE